MIFKLSLLLTFLFLTIHSAEFKKDKPFSVEKKWRASGCTCKPEPTWIKGVQQYHDNVVLSFGSFPRELLVERDLVTSTFQTLASLLIDSSNSKSGILSTGANTMLEAFSRVDVEHTSAQGIINEFYRILPILMKAYRGNVKNLTTILGSDYVDKVNKALRGLEGAFEQYIEEFNAGDENGAKEKVDYAPVTKKVQKLTDIIRQGPPTSVSQHQSANREVEDAMAVLSFILDHIKICNHGLSSCSEAVLLQQNRKGSSVQSQDFSYD